MLSTNEERDARKLTAEEVELHMAQIEKGQQLAGHFPDEIALDRARRLAEGAITLEEARAELRKEWGTYGGR